jgi:hypothetical protein
MNRLETIASTIIIGEERGIIKLDIDDFKDLYRLIAKTAQKQPQKLGETEILLLTREALVKFSTAPNFVVQVIGRRPITKKDFDIVLTPKFEGNIQPISWIAFIWTELVHNWWIIILTLALSYGFAINTHVNDGMNSINQSLIDANALFVGVFVLFAISQNRDLLVRQELIRDGITHQLMQNDYYITSFAITSLILALFSNVIVNSNIILMPINIPINNISIPPIYLAILFTSLSFALLLDCFVSVTKYYLKVQRTAIEGQMYIDLMGSNLSSKKDEGKKSHPKTRN